jgi:hypothetical protein
MADSMYKLAEMRMTLTVEEATLLCKAPKAIIEPALKELRGEQDKLRKQGKNTESMKTTRCKKLILQEVWHGISFGFI